MGTNFYFVTPNPEDVFSPVKALHMGKSSAGWAFCVRTYPESGIHDLADWKRHIEAHPEGKIYDEYRELHTLDEWLRLVEMRYFFRESLPDAEFLARNDAYVVPAKPVSPDGPHAVKHRCFLLFSRRLQGNPRGKTWECCSTDFS